MQISVEAADSSLLLMIGKRPRCPLEFVYSHFFASRDGYDELVEFIVPIFGSFPFVYGL